MPHVDIYDAKLNNLRTIPQRLSIQAFIEEYEGDRFGLLLTARPEDPGQPIWICGAQPSMSTLREALDFSGFSSKQRSVGIIELASPQLEMEKVAGEIAGSRLDVVILCISQEIPDAPVVRRDLERALFQAGLRKHPRYYNICGYEALNDRTLNFVGLYTCLAPEVAAQYPMAFLQGRRELHMDMLREEGMRSDAHVIRYVFAAEQLNVSKRVILDACCGYGYGSALLAHFYPSCNIYGIDIDPEAISYAQSVHSSSERTTFICSGLLEYLRELPACSVDAVCMFEGMEHLENISVILEEINRVLTVEGKLIVSVPNHWVNEEGVDPNPYHVTVYDWDNIRATLSQSLNLEACFSQIGSRLNKDGVWEYSDRAFHEVDPQSVEPADAEWWLCIASKRVIPSAEPSLLRGDDSFELEELLQKAAAPEIAVVSFDVFDTLLTRPTLLPEDVFHLLQSELVEERGELFSNFAKLRLVAEAEIRKFYNAAGVEDILLSEIYSRLRDYLLISNEEAYALMERELMIEQRLLRARHAGKLLFEAAQAAGKKVIIASDIYLTHTQLQRLLVAHGFDDVDKIYVSGELRLQKRRGTLFDKILQDLRVEGIKPEQVLHVGDNVDSDVVRPSEKGIMSVLFTKNTDAYTGRTAIWPRGLKWQSATEVDFGLRSVKASLIRAIFEDPFRKFVRGSTFDQKPFLYGALRLTPFLFFAMKDFIRLSQRRGIKRIYFVTRDGHLPSIVCARIVQAKSADIEVKDLHLSRKLLQALEIENLTSALRCLSNNLSTGQNVVLGKFISDLIGGPAHLVVEQEDWATLTFLNKMIDWGSLDDAQTHLRNLWPRIEPRWAEQRRRLQSYIAGCFDVIDPSECAIWDVGYFHTIAKSFDRAGYTVGLSGHLVEIGHHQNRNPNHTTSFEKYSYLGTVNNTQDKSVYDTSRHSVFLELLLSDPTSATRSGFDRHGRPIVMAEKAEIQVRNANVLSQIHNGVVTGVETVLRDFTPWLSRLECSPQQALKIAFHSDVLQELATCSNMVFDNGMMINFSDVVRG